MSGGGWRIRSCSAVHWKGRPQETVELEERERRDELEDLTGIIFDTHSKQFFPPPNAHLYKTYESLIKARGAILADEMG